MGGVVDGSPVNAANTNSAFLEKNGPDTMPFQLTLSAGVNYPQNSISTSGTINALDSSKVYTKLTGTAVTINGITSASNGSFLIISNFTGSAVIFNNASGSASAANRLSLPASSILLENGGSFLFLYDSILTNWVIGCPSNATVYSSVIQAISSSGITFKSNTGATIANFSSTGASFSVDLLASGNVSATGAITGSNLSGTNTGDITLAAIGSSPNANAASLSGQVLNLQPASSGFGGVVTVGTQTFAGAKTFSTSVSSPLHIFTGSSGNVTMAASATTASYSIVLPPSQGASGTVPQNDGTGKLSWVAAGSSSFTTPKITTYTSGSGTHTFTGSPLYVRVRMVGGGGGGAGSGTASVSSNGGTGGNTTFGTSLLSAGGGTGAIWNGNDGAGGSSSLGSGPTGIALMGGSGTGFSYVGASNTTAAQVAGGSGASSALGGQGGSGQIGVAGNPGATNTGGGGGGGGSAANSGSIGGGGGGAGGFVDAVISGSTLSGLSGSAPYSVGAAGTGGGAGTNGFAGGAGGSGFIEVTEYYQ